MNGAQALIRTLVDCGVDVCFGNPGTSEMHFVAALDSVPEMRAVLGLFEGVVTGAADGYGRMADRPAATLLHLGPGLANGMANLHNARRAFTPIVNVIGDHATYHKALDAPLESDIEALTGTLCGWTRRSTDADSVAADAAAAVAASFGPPGQIANLILPADLAWSQASGPAAPVPAAERKQVDDAVVGQVADVLRRGEPVVLMLGGSATRERALVAANRVASATGGRVIVETFPARLERGAGRPAVDRLAYLAEFATAQLGDVKHLVLAGARSPVSFFAYPGKPGNLVPDGCQVHELAGGGDDVATALEALADLVAPSTEPSLADLAQSPAPTGALTGETLGAALSALLPENAVVVDESNTTGLFLPGATAGAAPHDWLTLTGGAIGQGLPLATGAAIAVPDRPVLCLESDGSAMYTISALWTQARESLDVTTVLLNNRSYSILRMELQRVGAEGAGPAAQSLLDLSNPDLDFVSIATGMGVPASRATTADELVEQLQRAMAEPGPHLIDALVPPLI